MHRSSRFALTLVGALVVTSCDESTRQTPAEPSAPSLVSELGDPFTIGLRVVASGLTSPIAIVSAFDGTGRLFIVDQVGVIRILTAAGTPLPEPFLDLRDRVVPLRPNFDERGLLGLAFHPQYESNGRFFVYYNAPPQPGFDNTATFSEFRVSADPNRANPASERKFLASTTRNSTTTGGRSPSAATGICTCRSATAARRTTARAVTSRIGTRTTAAATGRMSSGTCSATFCAST
jgi:hypothetical protein